MFFQGLPPISVYEVTTTDGATYLELKVSTQTMLREGFWRFLDKYGFHYYDDSYCRPLLPSEVIICMLLTFIYMGCLSRVFFLLKIPMCG